MRVSETLHNQHFGLAKLTTIGEGSGLCVGTFLGAKNTSATINLEIHFFLSRVGLFGEQKLILN